MKEIYENYIANSYPMIFSMPEMDQYQKETFNPWSNMAIVKIDHR